MPARIYTIQVFSPAVSYTVPEGWTNVEDLLGNFLLQMVGDIHFIGVYGASARLWGVRKSRDATMGLTVEELMRTAKSPEIGSVGASLEDYLKEVTPIIESLQFGS